MWPGPAELFCAPKPPSPSLQDCSQSFLCPACTCALVLPDPRCRTLAFLNFMTFSSLSVPWLACLPSRVSPALHSLAWLALGCLQVSVYLWHLLFIPCATCICTVIKVGPLKKLTYWLEFLCAVLHMFSR